MFMPFLASFLIFVTIVRMAIRRNDDRKKQDDAEFFRKEREANFVRKKSLDDLEYVNIPMDRLPFGALPDDPEVIDAENTVRKLSERKIVNLTGISNTDLKLKYGTANITVLTEYDTNYMELARALQKWGKLLYDARLYEEAAAVLSFALDTRTDVSGSWHLYIECVRYHLGMTAEESSHRLKSLIPVAESLESLSKEHILEELRAASDS